MKKLITVLLLITLDSVLLIAQAPTTPNFLGLWYATYEWPHQKSPANKGTFKLVFEASGSAYMEEDSTKIHRCLWYIDSVDKKLVFHITKSRSVYRLSINDSLLSGVVTTETKDTGVCTALRTRTVAWDTLSEYKRLHKSKIIGKAGVEYLIRDDKTVRVHLGMMFNYGGVSYNPDLLTLTVTKSGSGTFISSNAILPSLSLILYALTPKDPVTDETPTNALNITPLLMQILTNFDLAFPLGTPVFSASVQQAADLFMFYNVSRIIPETKVGLVLDMKSVGLPFQFQGLYCIPWLKGYTDHRENYISVQLVGIF